MQPATHQPTSEQGDSGDTPLLEVRGLRCVYQGKQSRLRLRHGGDTPPAVRDVSLEVGTGETLAIVGESGCGKTTVARAVVGLIRPTEGEIRFAGGQLAGQVEERPAELRREIQYIFQNADASLNPRQRVESIVGRPLEFFFGLRGEAKRHRVEELLRSVYLDPGYADRFPGQLSGGEQQRIAIARALAAQPRLLICDEILTALDVSVQAGIVDLLRELQREHKLSYLFISHDLGVVQTLAHRVAVLYSGEVMETGAPERIFAAAEHPYTQLLLASIPGQTHQETPIATQLGTAEGEHREGRAGEGCPFAPRCPSRVGEACDSTRPPARVFLEQHVVRCHAAARSTEDRDGLGVRATPSENTRYQSR
jgi:peptide/nickel transport system ATP-binding protein